MPPLANEFIQFARLSDGIVIVRVQGKGTHLQSPSLRHVFEMTRNLVPEPRYIVDLAGCTTMDSTFLGTLASIGLHQRKQLGSATVVTNIQDHVRNLLHLLGLHHILELRGIPQGGASAAKNGDFEEAPNPEISKVDRLVMMIEAHENLIDLDTQNEVRFEGVLRSLRDSLEREERKEQP